MLEKDEKELREILTLLDKAAYSLNENAESIQRTGYSAWTPTAEWNLNKLVGELNDSEYFALHKFFQRILSNENSYMPTKIGVIVQE